MSRHKKLKHIIADYDEADFSDDFGEDEPDQDAVEFESDPYQVLF